MSTYSAKDDEVIIDEIGRSPNNLLKAFENAALKLHGRTAMAISGHYYGKLKNNSRAMVLMTKQGMTVNVKNTPRQQSNKSLALEIAEFALDKLTREEKIILAKRLMTE